LRRLAARHLFFDVEPTQALPYIDLAGLGLRSGATLSARTAADRESGVEQASAELVRHAALVSWRGFMPAQREAWRRLAPLLVLLDLDRWSVDERLALVDLARAKAGRSERDFVERYAMHPRLDAEMRRGAARAIGRMAGDGGPPMQRRTTPADAGGTIHRCGLAKPDRRAAIA
jgi:hypothetical protein